MSPTRIWTPPLAPRLHQLYMKNLNLEPIHVVPEKELKINIETYPEAGKPLSLLTSQNIPLDFLHSSGHVEYPWKTVLT